ncbi:hypothetical protein BX666DRAFT_1855008, partial [Dichotomocladium elegans]
LMYCMSEDSTNIRSRQFRYTKSEQHKARESNKFRQLKQLRNANSLKLYLWSMAYPRSISRTLVPEDTMADYVFLSLQAYILGVTALGLCFFHLNPFAWGQM